MREKKMARFDDLAKICIDTGFDRFLKIGWRRRILFYRQTLH